MTNFQPIAQDGWDIHHWYQCDGEVYHYSAPVAGWIDGQPAIYDYPVFLTLRDLQDADSEDLALLTGPGEEVPGVYIDEGGRLRADSRRHRRVPVETLGTD